MKVYAYRASLWCASCAGAQMNAIELTNMVEGGKWPRSWIDETDTYPKAHIATAAGGQPAALRCLRRLP
jgi:hypothetical protein